MSVQIFTTKVLGQGECCSLLICPVFREVCITLACLENTHADQEKRVPMQVLFLSCRHL